MSDQAAARARQSTSAVLDQQARVRNFCIIAHIDHGKSTLADRLIELCGTVDEHHMRNQVLDSMDLERERGITIKASAVRLEYRAADGETYLLNLIDTPGHVDFSYEVSRSLSACEGAVLVVDATQGVEAQTVANVYLALERDLDLIPVINKIDMPAAEVPMTREQLVGMFGFREDEILQVSAKTGEGVPQLLETLVQRVPAPRGDPEAPLRALVFDASFDQYRGIISYLRVMDGCLRKGQRIRMMATGRVCSTEDLGVFTPEMRPAQQLTAGQVGYVIAGIKDVRESRVGDTITDAATPAAEPLPGYREAKPMVFCGLYPVEGRDYVALREALDRLRLNDAALTYEPETSAALGFGFRCGFLGLLHMEIVQERLEREYDVDLIATAPSVVYEVYLRHGGMVRVDNPAHFPDPGDIERIEEPYVAATIMCPEDYVGPCMQISQARRGTFKDMQHAPGGRVTLQYLMPLGEILLDYFDQLKSHSRGYASLDYEFHGYLPGQLVLVEVMINDEPVDALAFLTHEDFAQARSRTIVDRMKEVIPRQLFEVRIQAAIGRRIIAASRVKPYRKNVIAKCYGGDITRKRKLLEKQKAGKKRMKQIGTVELPQEAFLTLLKVGDE